MVQEGRDEGRTEPETESHTSTSGQNQCRRLPDLHTQPTSGYCSLYLASNKFLPTSIYALLLILSYLYCDTALDVCLNVALMAPMATTYTPKFLKRPAPSPENSAPVQPEQPASKRIKRSHFRYRRSKYDIQRVQRQDARIQDEKRVQDMLTRSITLALEAVGFDGAEPEAVESFRLEIEECMT